MRSVVLHQEQRRRRPPLRLLRPTTPLRLLTTTPAAGALVIPVAFDRTATFPTADPTDPPEAA